MKPSLPVSQACKTTTSHATLTISNNTKVQNGMNTIFEENPHFCNLQQYCYRGLEI